MTEPWPLPEGLVERATDAMLEAMRAHLVEEVNKHSVDVSEFRDFFRSLRDESPRALAIVSYSYIDDRLRGLLAAALNPEVPGGLAPLFDAVGPLATSSARIKVATALYWLSPATCKDLDLLRKIRNQFAHRPFVSGFDETKVHGYLTSMSNMEDVFWQVMPERMIERTEATSRQIFHARAVLVCQRMMVELLSAPKATRMGLDPFTALSLKWAKWPQPARELSHAAIEVASSLLMKTRQGGGA